MRKFIIFYTPVFLLLFVFQVIADDLPKITFSTLNSNYRKIDKAGKGIPAAVRKSIVSDLGLGNIIFSQMPMEVEKEKSFSSVTDTFNFSDVTNGLYALAYFPGRKKNLVDYIEAKYEDCKYDCIYVVLDWHPVGAALKDNKLSSVSLPHDNKTMFFDQEKLQILPKENNSGFKDFNLLDIPKFGNSIHFVEVFVYLRFSVGSINIVMDGVNSSVEMTSTLDTSEGTKVEKRIQNIGNTNVNEEPLYRDFLVSYGKVNIINK